MTMAPSATAAAGDAAVARWVRAPGVELLGEYQGSGWTDPHYLVRRGDGQFAKLTSLLYRLLEESSAPRSTAELHAIVRGDSDLAMADVDQMLERQLAPAGMITRAGVAHGTVPAPTADPILALGMRGTVMPASLVQALARPLAHFFHRPVIAVVALTLLAADVWLLQNGNALAGLDRLIAQPLLALPLAVVSLVLPVLHELGHAAGCRYSGGRPGRIGFGVFIVWPALFTDVTDAYRLSKADRIRTDLGGLYFSVLGILLVIAAYALTGFEVLVLLLITLHVQAVQQLVPFVRTDGYYLLGDVAGVPNPFSSIVPVLRSALPGRPVDASIAGMRPVTRRIITAWVLTVVPFLTLGLGIAAWFLPRAVPRWIASVQTHLDTMQASVETGLLWPAVYAALSLLLLMVPLIGGLIVFFRVSRALARSVRRRAAVRHAQQRHGRS
jgi:putative peptide zinc metalloprotease protein